MPSRRDDFIDFPPFRGPYVAFGATYLNYESRRGGLGLHASDHFASCPDEMSFSCSQRHKYSRTGCLYDPAPAEE